MVSLAKSVYVEITAHHDLRDKTTLERGDQISRREERRTAF